MLTTSTASPFLRAPALGLGLLLSVLSPLQASDREAVKAIERTMPAVVSITTYSGGRPAEPGQPPSLRDAEIENVASGFFIDREGHLLTNAHVLEARRSLRVIVTAQDGSVYEARSISVNTGADLALLKVDAPEGTRFKSLNLKKISPNHLGQTVIALGNPVGYGNSISKGVLSATDRSVVLDGMVYEGLLQTDAAINPGSSGGPIVDLSGRLVGISSVKLAFDEAGMPLQGIGFAIPAEQAAVVLAQMEARESSHDTAATGTSTNRGFLTSWLPSFTSGGRESGGSRAHRSQALTTVLDQLGIDLAPAPKRRGSLPPQIEDIYLDSPADSAGLQPGEFIFRVNRQPLDEGTDFTKVTLADDGGAPLELEVGSIIRREGRDWKQVRVVQLRPEPR